MDSDYTQADQNMTNGKTSSTKATRTVRVWDFPTRVFHWGLAVLIAVAWMTSEADSAVLRIHVFAGVMALGFIVFRVLWGVLGTRHALFSDFVRGPQEAKSYAKQLLAFRPPHHLGHNPLGGWMVLALMAGVVLVVLSGMTVAKAGFVGPLASYFGGGLDDDLHEALANGLLALIIGHVGGVLVHGLIARENLPRAMVTGDKSVDASNSAQDIRSPGVVRLTIALAIAAACVLYFVPLL